MNQPLLPLSKFAKESLRYPDSTFRFTLIFVAACGIFAGVALLVATFVPVVQTAQIDPLGTIRND